MTKATLGEGEEIRHSQNWVVARRALLKVFGDHLECGDWRIPFSEIDDAVLFRTRQMFIPCYVLRVQARGQTYQFGLNPGRFWAKELPFPVRRETAAVRYSPFSILGLCPLEAVPLTAPRPRSRECARDQAGDENDPGRKKKGRPVGRPSTVGRRRRSATSRPSSWRASSWWSWRPTWSRTSIHRPWRTPSVKSLSPGATYTSPPVCPAEKWRHHRNAPSRGNEQVPGPIPDPRARRPRRPSPDPAASESPAPALRYPP